ncbi:hypothetical protein Poly30_22600 [Planctomycetes bacterium Poly30]|uniref:YHS domain protein n=1 Tax=Saltatorellus ferox TaxID=2528018 RepID=A0A518ERS1_9BACT|nr:hypothetical protein Poly30_22600 [Planctomycetes bacterium Poly30]
MRCLFYSIASILLLTFAFGVPAAGALTASTPDSVNTECPVSGQPVKAGMEVETKGGNIGVCCGKCKAAVEGWSETKKAEFVATFATQDGEASPEAEAAASWDGDPYLLTTCAASGRPIDVKGTPTTKVVDGRELKFCCGGCAEAVAADPAKWLEKVDKAQIAAQAPIYPMDTCCVSGEPLMEKNDAGEMAYIGTDVIVKNRLFRVCCAMCAKKVTAEPDAFALQLNAAVMEQQGKDYVLEACVVNDKGDINKESAKAFVVGGRLLKTCCGGCEAKVHADPTTYVAKVDAALAAQREKAAASAGK